MLYCRAWSCVVVMAAVSCAAASAAELRSEKQREEAIAQIEEMGARVILAPGRPKTVRRIDISQIVATRMYELRDGRIISGKELGLPAQFRYEDAILLLAHFPDVEELSLWGTPVTDDHMAHLKSLKNLKFLNLSGTKVTDEGLAHLAGLVSLEKLILGDTFHHHTGELFLNNSRNHQRVPGIRLTDQGLVHLKALPQLRSLNLRGTAVSDAGLAHLRGARSLRHVNLVETGITDRGLAHLYKHLTLETVELVDTLPIMVHLVGTPQAVTKTFVTPHGVLELKKRLPRCLVVYADSEPDYMYFPKTVSKGARLPRRSFG